MKTPYIVPPTPPPRRIKSSIKKRLTCICKQESVDSGGSNIVKLEELDRKLEAEKEGKQHLLSPVSGQASVSAAVASSPVQPTAPLVKAQFTVQSKSEQSLRPVYSVAGQQRKSFNAMSDYTSVKPITEALSKGSLRRNSLQYQTTSTDLNMPRSGLSRLLSADLSSAEFYAQAGWPKPPPKEKISPSIRIKCLPSESILIEEEKDSESQGSQSIVGPLPSERLRAEQLSDAGPERSEEQKSEEGEQEDDEYDSDYDYDDDYDIEVNFKYAKRDSQISQMLSGPEAMAMQTLQPEGVPEKKMSRSKRLTQKGKKMRRTVFKLSKRIKRKLNGSDKDKSKEKDDEKSQSLEVKEEKSSVSFLDRLTPSPKIGKGRHISSNKSSVNEPSQEFVSAVTDRDGSSTNEDSAKDDKADKKQAGKKEDKKDIDENFENTKRKLLSRPRALSNIAASLRFAPIPAIAGEQYNHQLITGNFRNIKKLFTPFLHPSRWIQFAYRQSHVHRILFEEQEKRRV